LREIASRTSMGAQVYEGPPGDITRRPSSFLRIPVG